jgi:hypothetical protein
MLQLNSPPSFMAAMFSKAAKMHASAIRLDVAPALIFPTRDGAPDFSGLDQVMSLARQYNLRVVADLFTIPTWMADCDQSGAVNLSRCPPDDESDYGAIITQIVTHADPVIRDWEIWNEPDTGEFFKGTPADYAALLRTAHDAIKAVDPNADVLLGGISGPAGMSWLGQVLATPGADAVHAFDTANVHERGWLDGLVPDLVGWRWFLNAHGFTGPICVTEHGYPADPAYQFDPHYTGGESSQAAYLEASIPSLLDAGASEVFVTERDNLGDQYASEGLLGGDVTDPPPSDPQIVERPAFAAVANVAACYALLGHPCFTGGPAATPTLIAMSAVRVGTTGSGTVTLSDPGTAPLRLGARSLTGTPALSIAADHCPAVLEPDQTCTVTIHFTPAAGGPVLGQLAVPSEGGALTVPIGAVATSVSSLSSPQLRDPGFAVGRDGDGVGVPQQLLLDLVNPLPAPVRAGVASLAGADAPRFRLRGNTCRGAQLAPNRHCRITVSFVPRRLGRAHAILTLTGDGTPLTVPLTAVANPPPAIRAFGSGSGRCPAGSFTVVTSEPARVSWQAMRSTRALPSGCRLRARGARVWSRRGQARTAAAARVALHRRGYPAPVSLGRLRPGVYRVSAMAHNSHGMSAPRAIWVTVTA